MSTEQLASGCDESRPETQTTAMTAGRARNEEKCAERWRQKSGGGDRNPGDKQSAENAEFIDEIPIAMCAN